MVSRARARVEVAEVGSGVRGAAHAVLPQFPPPPVQGAKEMEPGRQGSKSRHPHGHHSAWLSNSHGSQTVVEGIRVPSKLVSEIGENK